MSRHMVCPSGHHWDLEPDDPTPAAGLVCLFCGAPCHPAAAPALSSAATAVRPAGWSDTAPAPPGGAPDVVPDVPGYRVLNRLGRGGMGDVYLARQSGTGRSVALKTPRVGAALSELIRFRAEAEALAQLQHPGIVPVYEIGEAGGRLFLAMEYCPGGSLADRLDGTPLPPRTAAALTESLARAVHAAHRAGVVHRDLKPANVLLGPRPDHPAPAADDPDLAAWVPKVSDFGLARWLDSDSGLTQSGAVLGTPAYMAPEQAFGQTRHVGPPADVYALGVILYELLTGRPPFQGATALDTLDQLRTLDPVPPRRLQPAVPRGAETVCLKCLHKEPGRRYPSALALADDLRRFLDGRPVLAHPVGAGERCVKWVRRNPRVAALAGLLVAAVLAGLGGAAVYQNRLKEERDRASGERDRAVAHLRVAMRSVNEMMTEVAGEDQELADEAEARRRALLEKALDRYQELLGLEGDDVELRREVALATLRVGDIYRILGRFPESLEAYTQAVHQLEKLPEGATDKSGIILRIAHCHNWTGEVYRLTARPREAADEYRVARDLQQRVLDTDPSHAQARDVLAQSRYNLGLVYRDMNQLPEARAELEAAADLSRAAGSAGADRRWHLARALLNLGSVLRLTNEPGPADAAYAESITILDELQREAERDPRFRRDLARALINRANLHQKDRDPAATTALLLRAHELLAQLSGEFPKTPEYRSDLATACNGLAAAAFARRDRADAERWLVAAVGAWRKVLASYPKVPDYHAGLGMALGNLGRVRLGRGDGRQSVTAAVGIAAATVGGVPNDLTAVGAVLEEGLRELATALRSNPEQPECRASLRQQCADVARLAARTSDSVLAIRAADALAAALPTGSVGPVYGAFLLARFTTSGGRPEDKQACADRAFALLGSRPAAELAAHSALLTDAAFDGFRRDARFANVLPRR